MFAMFTKDMQQFRRSFAFKLSLIFIIASWAFAILAAKTGVVRFEDIKNSADMNDVQKILEYYAVLMLYLFGIGIVCFAGLITMLGSSAGRWRLELGDPAFSPGVTTCIPPYQLALGKWLALMSQLWIFVWLAGILPLLVFYGSDPVKNLIAMLEEQNTMPQGVTLMNIFSRTALVMSCQVTVWGSMTLAVCSLKPRSRSKFDVGTVVAMLILGPQVFGLLAGAHMDTWALYMVTRTVVLVIGSIALVSSGVAAPGANRLLFFKVWIVISVLFIMPQVYRMQGIFDSALWANECLIMAGFFLCCSLFERLTQSRRVLAQMKNPLVAVIGFPFSTGSLNSVVLSAIFVILAYFIEPAKVTIKAGQGLLLLALAAAFCNMTGFFFERKNWKFVRWLALLVTLMAIGSGVSFMKYAGYGEYLTEFRSKLMVLAALMTVLFNLPLIINYNYRKKGL